MIRVRGPIHQCLALLEVQGVLPSGEHRNDRQMERVPMAAQKVAEQLTSRDSVSA